ncbi:MAG: valine--tRNA ligase [Chitinophagaceae bacterium]|nr:valine--tRNA ligase [Chitinophagaceae bacterium]
MELSKNFPHHEAEQKWYQRWVEKGYFRSRPDKNRDPFTIVIPPPNVTGVLHMGHCLNNTIQDILIRRARMQGKNACWVPGTDHASIATEAKVVQMLGERGIAKSSLSREEFLKYAWEWKDKYGGIILHQLKKLGCSADWDRTTFTMDPDYYRAVIKVFVDLYHKGYIYRGRRMIHWDVKAKTALSDEEVIRKPTQQKLYYLKYYVEGSEEFIPVATVRPETIMGDTAVCVHPDDERYKKFHGKRVLIPLIQRPVPVITDEYVTMDFGSGALKITPAHDMNDYLLGEKHGLEIIDIFNDDGTLNEKAVIFVGEERMQARKKIIKALEENNYIIKSEDYTSEVGYSERTHEVVEPRLSVQWWVRMKKLAEPALNAVMNDEIRFYPSRYKNLYRHWMENLRDWCISRQLWWGHRIPAWYDDAGNIIVAEDETKAAALYEKQHGKKATLRQDEDCLDTWFSSWLWPLEVFKGISRPGNDEFRYYYPTQTLVTAPEIIFFWVARMIMAGYEYAGNKPFGEVYFTGIVRDEQGRKMSKQLGNSPDLLALIDRYGADAVRFGIMIASPAGNDLLFDVKEESTLKQGSFFINKMWNALKLVKSWEQRLEEKDDASSFAVAWFHNRLHEAKAVQEQFFAEYKISEALKSLYSLIWDEFCSWYLEWVKPAANETISGSCYRSTIYFFEELMALLHPFMPFVTEEIYHKLKSREDDLIGKQMSAHEPADAAVLRQGELLKELITSIRDARNKAKIKPGEYIKLYLPEADQPVFVSFEKILKRQVNAEVIQYVSHPVPNTLTVIVQKHKCYIEAQHTGAGEEQRKKLEKDLEYLRGFLASVEKKLSNERFLQNARPEIIETEKKKKADAEAKIKAIEESLQNLK